MRLLSIGALSCVSTLLSSVTALDFLAPGHSVAELWVAPENVTIMTPRKGKAGFEDQMFDFGSAQAGFSELRRVVERQQTCPSGYGLCSNDAGICCPLGGRCCGGGKCCGSGRWCYSTGCCLNTQNGCDGSGCCAKSEQCCKGGDCCPSGNNCVIVNGKLGCCPIGQTCTGGPTCTRTGYVPCEGETFCCPAGNVCYRDSAGNPMCRDPTPPQPSATSVPPEPSTTPPEPTSTSTYVPPEPSTSDNPPEPSTSDDTPPQASTVLVPTTHTQIVTQTYPVSNPAPPSTRSTGTSATTTRPVATAAAVTSNSTTNVGAIAGGAVAGVVVVAALILILIFWRRKKASEAAATGPQHPFAHGQPSGPAYNPGQPSGPAYNPGQPSGPMYDNGAFPSTPGTADPFLTPMGQHQNLGVSYFAGATAASLGPSGTGSGRDSQYTGLPEPQHPEYVGATGGALAMPVPMRDGNQPRPLPMTITSMQGHASDADSARPWSGHVSGPPSSGLNASGWSGLPEVDGNNSQPRWSVPASPNMAQAGAGAAYAANVPDRAPSTVYQPSSHAGGGYDDIYAPQSPPPPNAYPQSPPPPSAYGGMAPAEGSGLPSGAAPPVTNFAPGEKHVYRPY